MARVALVVSDEQKQRWNEFADSQPDYDNLSELVRRSVESQIASETSDSHGQQNEDRMDDILDALDNIETGVERNNTEMKALRQENLERDEMESVIEIMMEEIFANLDVYAPELAEKQDGQLWVNTR